MSCQIEGNADMYGLGIRTGFYLQWFGSIIAEMLYLENETLGLRFTNSFFVAATFLALLIQVAANALSIVDVYIVLLLTYGAYYYLVPLFLWRFITCFDPFRDPSRWPRVEPTPVYSVFWFLLLVAVATFQMWYWCTGIHTLPAIDLPAGCQAYGFFLAMIQLDNTGFVVANILLNLALLIGCFAYFCLAIGIVGLPTCLQEKQDEAELEQDR